jgi:uncharacterized protein (TIGR00156 family)
MKIASSLILAISLLGSGTILAQYDGPGANPATTVKEVVRARPDMTAVLTGNLVEQVGREDYTFRDSTGAIWVKIGRHLWDSRHITPETTVRITGDIDLSWTRPKVNVELLEVVSGTRVP